MAVPSQKAPELEIFLQRNFNRTTSIQSNTCVSCNGDASTFKDQLSKKEYTISGLCQKCQDDIFG